MWHVWAMLALSSCGVLCGGVEGAVRRQQVGGWRTGRAAASGGAAGGGGGAEGARLQDAYCLEERVAARGDLLRVRLGWKGSSSALKRMPRLGEETQGHVLEKDAAGGFRTFCKCSSTMSV